LIAECLSLISLYMFFKPWNKLRRKLKTTSIINKDMKFGPRQLYLTIFSMFVVFLAISQSTKHPLPIYYYYVLFYFIGLLSGYFITLAVGNRKKNKMNSGQSPPDCN
jgi:hypothetical protein